MGILSVIVLDGNIVIFCKPWIIGLVTNILSLYHLAQHLERIIVHEIQNL